MDSYQETTSIMYKIKSQFNVALMLFVMVLSTTQVWAADSTQTPNSPCDIIGQSFEFPDSLANVAIFKDSNPWGNTRNQDVLTDNSISYTIYGSASMGVVDLSGYDKVIIASVQDSSFYTKLQTNIPWFEAYVSNGGILDIHSCTQGLEPILPGGFAYSHSSSNDLTIVDSSHHILITPNTITEAELDGVGSSVHGYISTFPAGAHEILEVAISGNPCAMEVYLGSGRIFVTSQTIDFYGSSYNYLENTILYDLLAPRELQITGGNFYSSGLEGGPFTPQSMIYTVTNTSDASLDWTAAVTQPWLDLNLSAGRLGPNDSNEVTISINANANSLPYGIYDDSVTFTNVTSGISQARSVELVATSTELFYWVDSGTDKVQRADLTGTFVEDLVTSGLSGPRGIDVDLLNGKIYWTDYSYDRIQRANLDGSNVEDLVTAGLNYPMGIALDVLNGKMYWTDYGYDRIQRANLDGSNIENLITTGLSGPHGIALDVLNGKMYWTDYSYNKIQRANLDGSNIEDLVTGLSDPYYVALDTLNGKMYWTDYGYDRIQRANLDGSNVENIVTTGLSGPYGITVDSQGGKVYWTDLQANKIQRANLDGSNVEDLITTGLSDPAGIVVPQNMHMDDLEITPYIGLNSEGFEGGPFSPASVTYTLTNNGYSAIDWTALKTMGWLDVLPASGVLEPNEVVTVEVTLNAIASALPLGNYHDQIIFTNQDTGIQQRRSASLAVVLPEFKLTASDGYSSDIFGYSVSIDGDTVIVGAHGDDDSGSSSGSAYIFQQNGNTWTQQAKLTASDGYSSDLFGYSVSIDGDTVIVGAHQNDDNGSNSGSAYIFQRNGTIWTQQAKLTASDGYSSDLFGSSVSIDGDTVIAGAYGDDDNGSESGSAYIYEKTGGSWTNATETVKLVSRDGAIGDRFGYSVGISNGLSVIGAYYDDDQGTDSGSAYVFGSVDPLHIEAAVLPKDFISSGDEGGPFAPSTKTYILTNNDVDTLNWTASVYQSWLDIAPAAGTLAAGASVTLEVTLNAGVNSLAPGNYNDSIVFSNTTSGQAQSRLVRLDVLVVPGEIEVVDSIPEPNMPFGDVIIGLTATETITIKNVDPDHALVISQIGNFVDFEGFFEEFTSTTLDPSKWTVSSGVPQIDSIGINEPSEPYSLRLNGTPGGTESIESVPMDFSGASDLVLVYWYEQTGGGESPDSGEDLVIECWNGSSWIELDRQLGSGPDMSNYVQRIIPLPAAAMHLEFKLKIEKSSGSSCNCDDWFVDDVSIVHIDQIGSVVDVGATPTSPVIELDQPFKLENIPPMPLSLPPLGEITFDVLFEPLDKEDYEYELTIISDDRDEPEINLTLSGSGIDDYLEVSPEDAVSFTGHPGGPFMPSSQSYQLTNTGPIDVDWGADPNMPWISVTPASGRLKVGESTTVTIEWTPAARQLPPGGHRDILNITNLTTTLNYERTVIVDVYTEAKVMTSPLFFDVSTPYATLLPEVLTIGNTGDAALEYSVRAILDDYTPFSEQGSQGEQMQTMSPEYSVHEEMDLTVVNGTSPFVEREVLVRFAQVASMDAVDSTWLDNILAQMGGAEIKRHYSLVPGLKLVTLPDEITVEQALVDYSTLDGVQYVQPNYEVNTNQTIPNDSYFADLWGMHNTGQAGGMVNADINAPEAWDISTGSEDVIVAVIDTGIDYGHPDLIDNTWINYPEYNGTAGVDDDGNGYIDDIYGYDFAYKDSDPYDGHYHGTHCAGTIGAAGDNAQGVAGVCWKVKLMAVKFLNDSGSGYDSDAIDSIEYAVSMGARIMSCSWGGGSYNQGLKDAIDAAGAAGVILVAAAGNDNSNNNIYPHYPSSYDCTNIIAVMSTDRYDSRSSFSCYGSTSVDVGAPGSDIYSCSPGNSYRYLNGTSMATPHVSGACALMLSRNSALSVPEIKDILFNTVDQTLPGQCVSEGRMNVYEALLEVPVQSGGVGGTWIQFSSSSGIIAPDDANDIELTFDAGRNPGIYTGRILLTSNDPYSPEITMPVTFTVEAVDYCTQIFDPNGNDLSYQSFVFKKGSFGNYYTACRIPVTDFPVDPNGGVTINLQDDDYVRVDLISKLFNFYGNDYDHFYVGSNGYLTFGSGDFFHVESLDYHFTLPRISALFDDLDPTAGGQVSYKQLDDRIAVTYQDISEFGMPGLNSFQIEMLIDGTIRITCLEISAEDGLIGLSEGDGLSPLFFESDFSQYEACDFKSDLNHDLRSNLSDFSIFSGFWLMEEYPIATIRDEFNAVSYDGNDGMQNWSTDWQETGEPDGPTAGVVMVLEDGSLRVGDLSKKKLPAIALARQVNISSATTALLTFDYTIQSDSNKGEILVQASNDGGVYWDTLDTFTPSAGSGSAQYDFTSYISDYAGIRFRIEEDQRFEMYMYIDNVQLEFDSFDAPWYSWSNGSDIDQNFIVDFNDLMIFIDHWLE